MPTRPAGRFPWASAAIATMILVAGIALFAAIGHRFYPIQHWLFWRYAGYWIACAAFSVACLGLGHTMMRLVRRTLPLAEHTIIAFTTGLLLFELGVFGVGLLHGYGNVFFFAFPLVICAATAVPLVRYYRPALRRLLAHRARRPARPWWQFVIPLFGAIVLGLIYFTLLSPDNVQFDARWKHLAFAEDLVAYGGVHRFEEGWIFATRAHFTSYLYTWAFTHPSGVLFDRIELSQHIEFTVFLWTTLLGIPVLVRRLVPRADPGLVWAARFLFPGVLLHDSNLSGGADHIVAAFCVPAYLLTRRAWRKLDSGILVLLAATAAAVLIGKETATIMILPAAAAVLGVRVMWFLWASVAKRVPPEQRDIWWRALLVAMVAGIILSAPHWLANMVWHGDPFYPVLHGYFSSDPWLANSGYSYDYGYVEYQMWRPERSAAGVLKTLRVLATFSFVPNDHAPFHGDMPVFGSLMTLLLPCMIVVRRIRPIWGLALWIHLGIFGWYWVHHQDRYLQAILPWMAALTAAMIILVWRMRYWWVRTALVGVIALQIVWGGDTYFIQTHTMVKSPLKHTADLLAAGYQKKYEERLDTMGTYGDMREVLPTSAHVLLHENQTHLGLGVTTVQDWSTWQYAIDYGTLLSPREVYDLMQRFRITHVLWPAGQSRSWDSLASDIMFFDFALHHTANRQRFGKKMLAELPSEPPAVDESTFGDRVAVLPCANDYHAGIYRVRDLQVPSFGPHKRTFPEPREPASDEKGVSDGPALVEKADIVVIDERCHEETHGALRLNFELATVRLRIPPEKNPPGQKNPPYEIWFRRHEASNANVGLPPVSAEPEAGGDDPSDADDE